MSLPLLLSMIDEASKEGSISHESIEYLKKKAEEFNISIEVVNSLIESKGVKVVFDESPDESALEFINIKNKDLRDQLDRLLAERKYDLIISFFEEKLYNTIDAKLVNYYLIALNYTGQNKVALDKIDNFKSNLQFNSEVINPILGKIYFESDDYGIAFKIYYNLYSKDNPELLNNIVSHTKEDLIQILNAVVKEALSAGRFDLIRNFRVYKNYYSIAEQQLLSFYEDKNYNYFITLFESDFENELKYVKKYIWSLYKNNDTEHKAYSKGKYYYGLIETPSSLDYVMGLICAYIQEFTEAYDYYTRCQNNGIDVAEDIDNLIDKIISLELWDVLKFFDGKINYNSKLNLAFEKFDDSSNHTSLIELYNHFFSNTSEFSKVSTYINSLKEIDSEKALHAYIKESNRLKPSTQKYWFWLGGEINENNNQFEQALELYTKANQLESGYCDDDVKRMNYLLHPEIEFKDLYDLKRYDKAIDIFEHKLIETQNPDLLLEYLWALYKNNENEKALNLAKSYSNSISEGHKFFYIIAEISKYLSDDEIALEYYLLASKNGYDVAEKIDEVKNRIEQKRIQKEEEERRQKEEQRRIQREEEERRQKEEQERIQRENEEEYPSREMKQNSESNNSSSTKKIDIGNHHFTNDFIRGGDVLLKEHIYINNNEVRWEKKKTLLFGKDTSSIPIKYVSNVILETSLIGTDIKITSQGKGVIYAENFSKSDAEKIKRILFSALDL